MAYTGATCHRQEREEREPARLGGVTREELAGPPSIESPPKVRSLNILRRMTGL